MRAEYNRKALPINSQDTSNAPEAEQELVKMQQRIAELETLLTRQEQAAAAEHDQRVLAEIFRRANTALHRSLAYENVLDCILEQLDPLVSHEAACVMLVEDEAARIFRWHGYQPPQAEISGGAIRDYFTSVTFDLVTTPALRLMQETSQPLVISSVEESELKLDRPDQSWIKSSVGAAIRSHNQLLGFLIVDSATPNFYSQTEADRLQLLADLAANALKNAQLYHQARQEIAQRLRALKKERNFVAAVLDTAGALMLVLDPQGRILRVNRTCEQTSGYPFAEIKGKHFWDLFPVTELAAVKTVFETLLTGQFPIEYEGDWLTKDGRRQLIAWSNNVLLNTKGRVEFIICAGVDITEHRRLEERLLAIYQLGHELTLLRSEEAIFEIVLETAASLLQFDSAGYGVVNEVTGKLEYCYHPIRGLPTTIKLCLPLGAGGIDVAVTHMGQAINAFDATGDAAMLASSPTERPCRSWLSAPMKIRERVIGVLDIESREPTPFNPNDQQLLQTLADQTAVAIENARLFEAERTAREQAETLREATRTLTSTLDPGQVLENILVYLEQVVPYDGACVFFRQNETLHVVAERGLSPVRGQASQRTYSDDIPLYQTIAATGHPVILADVRAELPSEMWDSADYVRGWMGVPLMVQSEVIGCLTLSSQRVAVYGRVEAALAQAFANQAAVAVQNARLFEQVRDGRKRLKSLSHRLVEVQETERRYVARELHDEASQALTSLMVGLHLLEREVDRPEVIAQVGELKQMTNNVLENLHRLAVDLRPASLDHLGLIAAMRQYVEAFERQHGLTMQFEVVGLNDERLPPAVETNLYRIVQEALTNVVRHAQASHVDVLLERRGDQVVTIVEDNGIGFDPDATGQSTRLGLLGMRERAEMLGGTLVVESSANTGTTIYVEVPYVHSHSDR
jgi:PAS domain S-box-containing protein